MPLNTLSQGQNELFTNLFASPFKLKKSTDQSVKDIWDNLFSFKAMSFSPDGTRVCVEESPFSAYDLRRESSAVKIYDVASFSSDSEKNKEIVRRTNENFRHSSLIFPIVGPGEKLNKSASMKRSEINPIWSPDGNSIAYTIVDFERNKLFVEVFDLSGEISVISPNINPLDTDWALTENSSANTQTMIHGDWGNINLRAVRWSQKGDYLWIADGSVGIVVCKRVAAQWKYKRVPTESPPLKWASRGSEVVYLQDNFDVRGTVSLKLRNIDTEESQVFRLPVGTDVRALSW